MNGYSTKCEEWTDSPVFEKNLFQFYAYEEVLLCFRLLVPLVLLSFFPSFTCFQIVVLFTSSVILIGFDGMINDNFAFAISKSPGYGGGWSCCCNQKQRQNGTHPILFIERIFKRISSLISFVYFIWIIEFVRIDSSHGTTPFSALLTKRYSFVYRNATDSRSEFDGNKISRSIMTHIPLLLLNYACLQQPRASSSRAWYRRVFSIHDVWINNPMISECQSSQPTSMEIRLMYRNMILSTTKPQDMWIVWMWKCEHASMEPITCAIEI